MIKITVISILSLQAFIISFLLFLKHNNKQASKMLGFVLLFWGFTTLNFALYSGLLDAELLEYIPYLRLELIFGLGPSLYLYTKSVTRPNYKLRKWDYLLFLPAILELLYYRTSYYRDYSINIVDAPTTGFQYLFILLQWTGLIYSSIFIVLSVYLLFRYKKWLYNNYSFTQDKSLKWLHTPVVFFVTFWFIWFGIHLTNIFLFSGMYSHYYYFPMFIILSIITLWIGLNGYIKSKTGIIGFDMEFYSKKESDTGVNYSHVADKIKSLMGTEQFYLDPDFNLQMLSEKSKIQSKYISKAINQSLNMNFHEFVNRYRVNEFIERIKNDKIKKFTLLAHAYDSGFASKSTFNHIFKKYTNKTPKEYFIEIHNKSD